MSFRRLPFQFSTTDPVERQRELEKRFGLPLSSNMFVDVANPLSMGAMPKDSSISSSSPRLQHRVPIFVEGYDQPAHSSVDSTGAIPENKKPNVRVIPIEVEGRPLPTENTPISTRHRTFSGPAGIPREHKDEHFPLLNDASPLKCSMVDLSEPTMTKSTTLPRVHTIPIQVEGARNVKNPKFEKVVKSQKDAPKINGCAVSKSKIKSPVKDQKRKTEVVKAQNADVDKPKSGVEVSLKKIADVLEELKSYEAGVQEFSGTTKDKQYRYLDEMLTRCMLKLDDIDTMGNENVRSARKNAVKKTQACIDLLESKANSTGEAVTTTASKSEVKHSEQENQNDVEMVEGQDTAKETTNVVPENLNENTSQNDVEHQKNEVEMTDSEGVGPKTTGDNVSPEVIPSKEDTETAEISSEVPEVDMAEIKAPSQDSNPEVKEIPEVEMTDNTNKQSIDNIPVIGEKATETANVQQMCHAISQEDVEMKDVQSAIDDIKESVVNCTSSQPVKEIESCVSTDIKTSSDNVVEEPTEGDGEKEECQTVSYDSDIKTEL